MRTVLPAAILVVITFALVLKNGSEPMDMPRIEFALNWTQRAAGIVVAASAALGLLLADRAVIRPIGR